LASHDRRYRRAKLGLFQELVHERVQDNSRHAAKVIGRDEKTDIALIKIDTNQKLP